MGKVRELATRQYEAWQRQHGQDRGKDFFGPEAELTLPARPDPWGDYEEQATHTCDTYFDVSGGRAGPSNGVLYTGHAWRKGKTTDDGRPIAYCEGCYQKRVRRYVEQVIQEVQAYPRWNNPFRYVVTTNAELRKAKGRWAKEEATVYKAFPGTRGRLALAIHNRPDPKDDPDTRKRKYIGGDPLPTTRAELFTLLYDWCQTPEGRRIDGSKGFGGHFQGAEGDGRKKEEGEGKGGAGADDEEPTEAKEQIRIVGNNHSGLWLAANKSNLLSDYGEQRGKLDFRQDVTWPDLIEVVTLAGIPWKVKEGEDLLRELLEASEVSHSLTTGKKTVTKSGKSPPQAPEREGQEGEERANKAQISEPKQAPINWEALA